MPSYDRARSESQATTPAQSCTTASTQGPGNAAVQERIRSEPTVDPDADCDVDDLADTMTRDAFFATQFTERDFQPSTGFGRFDASYEPTSGTLDIVLRLAFDFTLPEGASYTDRAIAALTGDTGWDPSQQAAFIEQYKQVVESTWSAAHTLQCVRPGWEQVIAVPRLRIEVVDPEADPHYVVTVHGAPESATDRDEQRPLVREPGLLGGPGEAEMDHDDVDSRALGGGVVRDEIARVEALLPKPGLRVEDDGTEARLPAPEQARLRQVAEGLARSEDYPSGPQFSLEPVGWAQAPAEFEASGRGARAVGDALASLLPRRTGEPVEWGDAPAGYVSLRIPEHERQQARAPAFSFAAHETGHMLGLEDEYAGGAHGDHAPEAAADLQRRAGVDAPRQDADTSSVLSQGKDVLPAHYVTIWEVLTRMTAGYLAPAEWRIGR